MQKNKRVKILKEMERGRNGNSRSYNLPGEKRWHGVGTYYFVCHSLPFFWGPSVDSFIRTAHLPPSWTPNSRHMATMGTAMAKHCDPPLWLEFIGPGVGLDPSWLIRMHQWEFGNRIELFQPHLAAQWNRDVSLGIIGDLFSQEDGGAGRTGQQCKRILQSQKELCRQESN